MVKLCPKCGASLSDVIGGYLCPECGGGMFDDDEVIIPRCPSCGDELGDLMDSYYCYNCSQSVSKDRAELGGNSSFDNYDFNEPDYDSMVNNGDEICLNCTFWSVSPYGASYGMVCRKGQFSDVPGDSCGYFTPESHFASYGNSGEYQFDETGRAISNKLYHWKNNR